MRVTEESTQRPRSRDLGITLGRLPCGSLNAITDVEGVLVGHCTLIQGEGKLVPGRGPIRTGVTAILPHGRNPYREKVAAGVDIINGYGKCVGLPQIMELGQLESPILLTSTLNVWLVADALLEWSLERNPDIAITTSTVNVVVGECHDGYLNDAQGRHVRREHVYQALEEARSGPVVQGAVGAGTGMSCFEFKGGVGTSSRCTPDESGAFTVGALVVSNFGTREQLVIGGVPVGLALPSSDLATPPLPDGGSVMIVLATDAPLTSRQLTRIARRAAAGLARTGSTHGQGSGDFAIAFSTTNRHPHDGESWLRTQEMVAERAHVMNCLFQATVEATEEAVIDSMFQAHTIVGRDGHVREALPIGPLVELMHRHGWPEVGRKRLL
ncbi:MAG: P1 family peptidase [Chloroflexota bacterium]